MKLLRFKTLIISIVFAVLYISAWYGFLTPLLLQLPDDFSYDARVASTDNFYDETIKDYRGEQYSTSDFQFKTIRKDGRNLALQNTFDVKTPAGESIIRLDREYVIDQQTLTHVSDTGDRTRNGYLFAPRGVRKTDTFTYWHINYDGPAEMKFIREEKLYDLDVYVFESTYTGVTIDQTQNLQNLPGVPDKRGVILNPKLQIWVEPSSGMMVKYQDETIANYYDIKTKEIQNPWNKFSNTFTDESVKKQVENARNARTKVQWILYGIPVLTIIALVLLNIYVYFGLQIATILHIGRTSLITILVILVVSISLNIFVYNYSRRNLDDQFDILFDSNTNDIENSIVKRFEIYTNLLRSGVGLFNSSEVVTAAEWKEYIKTLEIEKNYFGVQGLGYARVVRNNELSKYYAENKSVGATNITVFPAGKRDLYVPVTYIQPETDRNLAALGFDMYSEKTRQDALIRAAKTGMPTMSGKVTLVQETDKDIQPGFLIYLPIYKRNAVLKTEQDRENAIIGYIYSPFRINNFIDGAVVSNPDIDFQIWDGSYSVGDMSHLFYTSKGLNDTNKSSYDRVKTKLIYVNNHAITVVYYAKYSQSLDLENIRPYLIAGIGSVLSVLVLISYYLLASGRKRAQLYSVKLNKDLIHKDTELGKAKMFDETLLQNIGEGVMAIDNNEKITFVNTQCENLIGYSAREVVGKKFDDIVKMYDKHGNLVNHNDRPIIKALEKGHQQFAYEVYYSGKGKEKFPISTVVTPILGDDGKAIACVAIFRDITDELNVNKSKTEFVSLASHQLKTPQTSINWYAEMLLSEDVGALNDEQREYVSEIYYGNIRMIKLVDSLLNVSRIDLGSFSVSPKPTNILEICDQVIKELSLISDQRNIKIVKKVPTETPLLNLDPDLFRIILQNMISNAIKYSFDNCEITIEILISDKIYMKFINSGIGIPKPQQDRIFQKLFRADNAINHAADGNGLGLYIVKSILEQSGGEISFDSEENKTTTFFIECPLEMKERKGSKFLE